MFCEPMEIAIELAPLAGSHAGSYVEVTVPEFDPTWETIDQWSYMTGCIKARTGITIKVRQYDADGQAAAHFLVEGANWHVLDHEVPLFLRAVESGARAATIARNNQAVNCWSCGGKSTHVTGTAVPVCPHCGVRTNVRLVPC